jgi:hypothetical protein
MALIVQSLATRISNPFVVSRHPLGELLVQLHI